MTRAKLYLDKMMNTRYVYSSTQINLPSPLASEIIRWGEECIPDSDLFVDPNDIGFGREDETHVTILYGLHSDNPDDVRKLLTGVDSFEIELGKTSLFTWSDKFDVIKIEAFGDELHRLNKLLSRLPSTQMFPYYKPHVTIAYIKKGSCDKLVGSMNFVGKIWMSESVVFSTTQGVRTNISLKRGFEQ